MFDGFKGCKASNNVCLLSLPVMQCAAEFCSLQVDIGRVNVCSYELSSRCQGLTRHSADIMVNFLRKTATNLVSCGVLYD